MYHKLTFIVFMYVLVKVFDQLNTVLYAIHVLVSSIKLSCIVHVNYFVCVFVSLHLSAIVGYCNVFAFVLSFSIFILSSLLDFFFSFFLLSPSLVPFTCF